MPRKHPSRGYYDDEEEIYDVDHGRPRDRHRSKRDRVKEEEDLPPRRRRASIPPVEEMERMRIKDRRAPSSPEYVRESGRAKGKGKAQPPPPPQELKFRRGRGEVKRSSSIPPPPPSPPSEAERDDYRPSSRGKKSPRGKNGKKASPDEYVSKDRLGGRRSKAKQIAALMSDSEDDISVKRSSRAAAAAAPPPPPPLPGAMPEDDDDDDESEAEFMRRERRRRKGKMIEPNYSSAVPPPPRFPHKPNTGRHRGKEREDVRRRAPSRSRARSLSAPRRAPSESDDSETDTTEETESSTEESEDEEDEEDDEEDDELVILKDEWGRGNRRSRSLSRPAIKSRRDDSSPGSPSLRELSLASRHGGRRPKYIEQEYEVVKSPPATGMDLAPRAKKKRSKDDTSIVPRLMDPPEPRRRRKKAAAAAAAAEEAQLAHHKSHAAGYEGRGREVSFREHSRRRSKSARAARDDMDLDVYSRRRPDLPQYAGPPGGPPGADMSYMGPPGTAPGPMGMPHPQSMMPMGRPPHPSEMGWQQPRAVPDPRYYTPSEGYSSEEEDVDDGQVGPGRRYIGMKDHRDRLWTEITKDLVVRDAVERFGFEYEETDSFFYIFSYLHYEDVAALVEMSDQIRHARRRRIHEINRGRGSYPSTHVPPGQGPPPPPPAAVTGPPQAPIASGSMAPMLPVAPPGVAPVVPAGYERYAAAAPPQQQPPPPPGMPVGVPGPMMNPAQQPWPSWDGNRGRERDMYNDHHPHHRWRAPPAQPAPPGAWPAW